MGSHVLSARPRRSSILMALLMVVYLVGLLGTLGERASEGAPGPTGAIFTTTPDGGIVNENVHYEDKRDVYLDGGPPPNAPKTAAGLDDGLYVFQITDPSGKFLLSEDPAKCRVVEVEDGVIVWRAKPDGTALVTADAGFTYTNGNGNGGTTFPCHIDDDPPHPTDPGVRGDSGRHDTNVDADHGDSGAVVVQMMPYGTTPNPGGVYKAWITPISDYLGKGGDLNSVPKKLANGQQKPHKCPDFCAGADKGFGPSRNQVKTDNFKVKPAVPEVVAPEITVRKFWDRNNNGVWDDGEPEIGADTCVDEDGNLGDCADADFGGWPYSFTDTLLVTQGFFTPNTHVAAEAGIYVVTEDILDGWTQTALYLNGVALAVSPTANVTVLGLSGETHEVIFGNFLPSSITACKFYDFDGDGIQDGLLEVDLAGWPMTLAGETFEGDPVEIDEVTGAEGCVTFEDLLEGDYEVTEGIPNEDNWEHTSPATAPSSGPIELGPGDSETVEFGNRCFVPFVGGLTMGYWKTHTGLDSPGRDATYDVLNGAGFIMLGIFPEDGFPEQQVDDEAEAKAVFDAADCSGDCLSMLKAQLLAAKLNVLKFPGFDDAEFPDGTTVGDVIAAADQLLDDIANGVKVANKAEIEALANLLDAANNNTNTPILGSVSTVPCLATFGDPLV